MTTPIPAHDPAQSMSVTSYGVLMAMLTPKRRIAVLGALLYLVGCGDGIGPTKEDPPGPSVRTDAEMHMLRQSVVPVARPGSFGTQFEANPGPKPLEQYSVTFTAEVANTSEVRIRYADGSDFLTFTVPAGALQALPDGTPLNDGDAVDITVEVDADLLLVTMQPTGLTFAANNPALLDLRYEDADPDYNGDGVVDAADAALQPQLELWVQQGQGTLWSVVDSDHVLGEKRFTGYLAHFCNYTVSW